jgi:hypothetical protein
MTILYIIGGFLAGFWLCAILANRRIHEAEETAVYWLNECRVAEADAERAIRDSERRTELDDARRREGGDNA